MRTFVAVSAAVLVCVAAGVLWADYDQANGQIKSIDAAGGKIVVAVRMGMARDAETKDTTFLVDKDTTIRINREKKTLADLKEGNRVSVTFKVAEGGGEAKALLINVFQMPAGGGKGGRGGGGGGAGGGGN